MMNEAESEPTALPAANERRASSHGRSFVLMALMAIGLYLCCLLAMPFLSALVWALSLAVVCMPLHRWLEFKLKRRNLAALFSVLLIGVIVVVPAIFVGQQLVIQAANGAQLVTVKAESGAWRRAIETRPRIARLADRIERQVDVPGSLQTLAAWLTNAAGSIVKNSVVQVVVFLLTFYLLFFFLRDRREALQSLRSISPLSKMEMDRIFVRVGDTIYATVYGTLVVSFVQGLLGGLMFWWVGLPAPLLWGVVMALLSMLPVLGAFVVWIPAAIFLALDGSWERALILTIWCMIVVGGIDNLLRPILVGNRLKLHTILVFISVVGGLILFGSAGFILGPVVLTVTLTLLEIWRRRTIPSLR